jgi:Domain of unknown function (DUF4388)
MNFNDDLPLDSGRVIILTPKTNSLPRGAFQMALTGHLSDLSLSELIEFFCNQRKSGRLKVLYPQGAGYFYLQAGSVVDAQIGVVRGIEAVYYALTLPNAKFEFSASTESPDRTINQPWTQVVLEGLRRLDEGITPPEAFPANYRDIDDEPEVSDTPRLFENSRQLNMPGFLSFIGKESMARRKSLLATMIIMAVLGSVAAVGVPAGWYSSKANVTDAATQAVVSTPIPEPETPPAEVSQPEAASTVNGTEDTAGMAARRQRDRERSRAREERPANQPARPDRAQTAPTSGAATSGPKRVAVTVTYDESGRVVQASGADASAIRIARQKRFPPGKAGSATVTIPIN